MLGVFKKSSSVAAAEAAAAATTAAAATETAAALSILSIGSILPPIPQPVTAAEAVGGWPRNGRWN